MAISIEEKINSHDKSSHSDVQEASATLVDMNTSELEDDEHHPNDASYWRSFRFIGSLLAIVLMANTCFIGYAMPVNILTVIDADIGPSPNIYVVSMSWTLVSGVMLLVVGRISDIVGRRYFMISGQLIAAVGSIICARATSINMVIAGTVLTGLSGAGQQCYPLLVQELVPNKYRIYGQAAITVGILPTIGFGPLFARALVQDKNFGWRGCYWLNTIVAVVSVVLFFLCYFPPDFHMINKNMTRRQELKRLDYGGLFLYATGLVLLLLAFTWGQSTYSWSSAHVIAPLIVGILVLVLFFLYEIYMPLEQPLMPMKLLKIRNFSAVVIIGCVGQMVYYALNLLWPIAISSFFTTNNILIGLMSCTTGASLALGEVIVAPFFKLIGKPNYQLVCASILLTVFTACLSLLDQTKQALGIALTIFAGIGVGWVEAVTIVIAGLVVPPAQIGVSQGFYTSMRAVTGTISLSIYISIYANRLPVFLNRDITLAATKAGLPTSSLSSLFSALTNGTEMALNSVPGMNGAIIQAVDRGTKAAYHHSFKIVFLSSIAFGALAIVSSFFVQDVSNYLNNYVNKTIHRPNIGHHQKEDYSTNIQEHAAVV